MLLPFLFLIYLVCSVFAENKNRNLSCCWLFRVSFHNLLRLVRTWGGSRFRFSCFLFSLKWFSFLHAMSWWSACMCSFVVFVYLISTNYYYFCAFLFINLFEVKIGDNKMLFWFHLRCCIWLHPGLLICIRKLIFDFWFILSFLFFFFFFAHLGEIWFVSLTERWLNDWFFRFFQFRFPNRKLDTVEIDRDFVYLRAVF